VKALVLGANGFVGRYLTGLLAERKYEVIGTFHKSLPDETQAGFMRWVQLDICHDAEVLHLINDYQPDEVYHLAAVAVSTGRETELYYRVNFIGTLNVLKAIRECSSSARILFVGTASAYGKVDPGDLPVKEEQPLRPLSHYAASKAAAELAAYAYASEGLHVILARPFNHTGPGQSTDYVCSRLAKQVATIAIAQQEPVIEAGNLDVARDFTDVRDVVRAYWLLLQKGRPGEVYNVCSEKAYSIKEIVAMLGNAIGFDVRVKTREELKRINDVPLLIGSRRKISHVTGWEPIIPIERTLADTVRYWQDKLG